MPGSPAIWPWVSPLRRPGGRSTGSRPLQPLLFLSGRTLTFRPLAGPRTPEGLSTSEALPTAEDRRKKSQRFGGSTFGKRAELRSRSRSSLLRGSPCSRAAQSPWAGQLKPPSPPLPPRAAPRFHSSVRRACTTTPALRQVLGTPQTGRLQKPDTCLTVP